MLPCFPCTDTLTYGAASQPLPTTFSPGGDLTAGMHDC